MKAVWAGCSGCCCGAIYGADRSVSRIVAGINNTTGKADERGYVFS